MTQMVEMTQLWDGYDTRGASHIPEATLACAGSGSTFSDYSVRGTNHEYNENK
jgi:hypothetical protein